MDWSEIKELNNNGIEFATHSRTHLDLTRISIEEARREMVESKSAVENNLGVEVTDFAYPYGKYNAPVKSVAEEHFRTACSVRLGKAQFGDDLFSLKRLDAYYLSNENFFRSILSTDFDWYMSFRQAMRDIKAACYNK
jgi:peptidoglycan/xylan/chitin deacetylase (PgdA/CDA1 family)